MCEQTLYSINKFPNIFPVCVCNISDMCDEANEKVGMLDIETRAAIYPYLSSCVRSVYYTRVFQLESTLFLTNLPKIVRVGIQVGIYRSQSSGE